MWIVLAGALASLNVTKRFALLLLLAATLMAFHQHVVGVAALPLLAAIGLLAWLRARFAAHRLWQGVTEALMVAIAVALFLHLFPGFYNVKQLDNVRAGPHSAPFSLWFNFDKALIPFVLLACLPTLFKTAASPVRYSWQWIALLIAIPLLLFVAVLPGGLAREPHFPSWLALFMLSNLFFVSLAEEALFRGYLQQRLRQWLGGMPALLLTSLLFGLAHFAGGLLLVVFAALAGIIYGLAWHWSGRLWVSTLFHFAFNMTHLLFFTYPVLQR